MASKKIEIKNRQTGEVFQERVFGDSAMACFYGTAAGLKFTSTLLVKKMVSVLYGGYHDHSLSCRKIKPFIEGFDICVDECLDGPESYKSFNDFFARKLKPSARPIASEANAVASPGDGRILVFPRIDKDTLSYVKWAPVRLADLFGPRRDLAKRYENGSCAVLRLCPVDYHRFHFPADGIASATDVVPGLYHSVSPYSLEQKIPVYCLNKRTICELDTPKAGKMALMEVGALMVGSIVQTYEPGKPVRKGEEKGYFKFGGSTTILFFEPGAVNFDEDLVENSSQGYETLVRMGERIAGIRA